MDKIQLVSSTLTMLADAARWSSGGSVSTMLGILTQYTYTCNAMLYGKEVEIDDPCGIPISYDRGVIKRVTLRLTYHPYFIVELPDGKLREYVAKRLKLK